MCEARKSKLKASLRASESKQSDARQRVKELYFTKDTVDKLVTRVNEAEKALPAFEKQVLYLAYLVAETSMQLLTKDSETANGGERLAKPEGT